jgi:glycosyltransferase involved in cell wall biosynthesis
MRKRIAIIGSVGIPASYGGFETFVEALVSELSEQFDFTVYCSRQAYPERRKSHLGAQLKYVPLRANGVQSVPYDMLSMVDAWRYADVCLQLGVGGSCLIPALKLLKRTKVIVNIDGLDWSRSKWKGPARNFLKLSESFAARYADAIVADNKVIADYVSREYQRPCDLIEYGANEHVPLSLATLADRFGFVTGPYAFNVCRIEPENNIQMLLESFAESRSLPLVVVGNWSNSEYGQQLKRRHVTSRSLFLLDPIYDAGVLNALRAGCSLYVHGHSCGGTNPSLVEAMSLGCPVAAYDVNFNRETTEGNAFYFQSAEQLRAISQKSPEFAAMGQKMKEIAKRRYTWKRVAGLYAALFSS